MRKSDPAWDGVFAGAFKPAIWLRRVREQVSASKLGGLPWLPSPDLWPRQSVTDTPLHFLAQIDLSALPPTPLPGGNPLQALPREGMLFFFADMDEEQIWGGEYGPPDEQMSAVVFAPAGDGPTQLPPDLPMLRYSHHSGHEGHGFPIFPEAWIAASVYDVHAKPFDKQRIKLMQALGGDERAAQREIELRVSESAERGAQSEFPYWPSNRQRQQQPPGTVNISPEEFRWSPALWSEVDRPGDTREWSSPNFRRHQMFGPPTNVQNVGEAPADWHLLLQLDTDGGLHNDFMFCDCGIAHFWIETDDLVACRFERAWASTHGG